MNERILTVRTMADDERRRRVFAGEIVVFAEVPSMVELAQRGRDLAHEYLGDEPERAHARMDRASLDAAIGALQRRFTGDASARSLFRDVFRHVGVDLRATAWERWFPLRVRPPADVPDSRNTVGLGPHRDFWYACPRAQNNWWAPVFPYEGDSGLLFHLDYWSRPIANNSHGWSLADFRARRAQATERGADFDELTRAAPRPEALEAPDGTRACRPLLSPGDIMCFSAAHLHESGPNHGDRMRFSTERRSVHLRDIAEGAGAPNVDCGCSGDATDDFETVLDGVPLGQRIAPGTLAIRSGDRIMV